MTSVGVASILRADARDLPLADDSVDLVVTSPPCFAMRSYTDGGDHLFRAIDLWNMSKGLVLLARLRHYGLAGDNMEWHLPPDVLPGVTSAWGLPVRRVPDLPGPYLAHSLAYGVEP